MRRGGWCSEDLHYTDCDGADPCSCDRSAEAPNHTPMQPSELRAACEAYLRENGWKMNGAGKWVTGNGPTSTWHTLYKALAVQWARDGIGSAT